MFYWIRRAVLAVAFSGALIGSASAIDIQEVTSPGGIKAWLVSDNTVPLVTVDAAFRGAGAAQDPLGKAGLANLMSALLDEGAGDLDSIAFQTALEENAVRLSFDSARDHFYADLSVLSVAAARGFELLALALNEPRFDAEAIERMRNQIISGLRREQSDPDTVVAKLWSRTAFPDHPYGIPSNGTVESVSELTREDLLEQHGKLLAKDNLVVAVVGDITAEELAPLLDVAFGDLPETADLREVLEVEPEVGLTVSDTLDTPQTSIRFGGVGLPRDDDDFIPAFVMNHILGGGAFSSWLFEEVREERGLAYSVYSYLAPYAHTAVFGGGTATRNDQAEEALQVILAQFERMVNEGPSEEELADAKAFLTGSYALRFGSSGSIARQLLFIQLEELGINYINERNDLIDAVTLADVRRAARRIFGEGAPTVAIVGSGEG